MSWLDSLTIDGTTIPAWRVLRGLGSPPPRQELRDRARRHGSVDYTEDYQPRLLELTNAVLKGDPANPGTIWDELDALKQAFALGTEHVVRFRRSGRAFDERVVVKVASELAADLSYETPGVVLWSVALLAADPRIYADVLTAASYSPSAASGGVVFPLTFPLTFVGSSSSVLTVHNGGTFKTPPVLTVTGPATTFSIVNETTGEEIVFQGFALAATDTLVIDVDAREVILDGTSRPDLIDASLTTWWELVPGDNQIRLHGSGFADAVTTLAVSYRDARI